MNVDRYTSEAIIEYAIILKRSGVVDLRKEMKKKFPGITDYMIREAVKNIRILLAFKKIIEEEERE